MARVQITELFTGDANIAANANETITSWNTVSTDVDDLNVRDEGIDRRTLKRDFQVFGDTIESKTGGVSFFTVTAAVYTQVTPNFQIGGFDFADPDELVVRCSFDVFMDTANYELACILAWSHGAGGALIQIPRTERKFQISTAAVAAKTAGRFDVRNLYTVSHRFIDGPDDDVWFQVMAKISGGGSADLSFGSIAAVMYKK